MTSAPDLAAGPRREPIAGDEHAVISHDQGTVGSRGPRLIPCSMRLQARPTVYEINTAVWLARLGRGRGRPLGLSEVPGSEWERLAALPVDALWLMGVWQRSPAGRAAAVAEPGLFAGYRAALPDVRGNDVLGSPYCVREYVVEERFGGPEGLAAARTQLADRGVALILDYVPNHVALDHPWVTDRPQCFLSGSEEELARHPEAFIRTAGGVFAKGRDPYLAPWQDVLQLNAYAPALRDAAAQTVIAIGDQCDGVRCDMAMLMNNEVFARTWGERAGARPKADFWPTLIGRAKQAHPDLLLIAEVYWDMAWTLQQQGFDLCYDKRLYDRLVHDGPESLRAHLQGDASYQRRLLRFIENHDEPRAAASFGDAQARAAAIVMSTLPGARLYHDGQLEGHRTHLPVQLGREPHEPTDSALRAFYARLLHAIADAQLQTGDWLVCECAPCSDGDDSHDQLVAWCWLSPHARHLVAVNLSPARAAGRVRLPWGDLAGRTWSLADTLSKDRFERPGDELAREGLHVALEAWGSHFLRLEPDDHRGEVAVASSARSAVDDARNTNTAATSTAARAPTDPSLVPASQQRQGRFDHA
ncbi:MAG: alpha-amylase [Solirubrobacteraceae bacterium]